MNQASLSYSLLSREVSEVSTWAHTDDHPEGKNRLCSRLGMLFSDFPPFAHLPESACFLETFFPKFFFPIIL